jgi:GTP-binding protein
MTNYSIIDFIISAYSQKQLPETGYPEIAFAGRSNVGKSSLINKLVNRRSLVKVSSKPGKTQSLNYFEVDSSLYLVDLPGYGFAKVPKGVKNLWQGLISSYIENRATLCCLVVIIDIRHPLKAQDRDLVSWLKDIGIPHLPVYTKLDKITRGQRHRHAAALDAGLGIPSRDRTIFSAKTGEGKDELMSRLEEFIIK